MDCRLYKQDKEIVSVKAANNKESKLYWALVAKHNDKKKALEEYKYLTSNEFLSATQEILQHLSPTERKNYYDTNGEIILRALEEKQQNIEGFREYIKIEEKGLRRSKKNVEESLKNNPQEHINHPLNDKILEKKEYNRQEIIKLIRESGSEVSNRILDMIEHKLSPDLTISFDKNLNIGQGGLYDASNKTIKLDPTVQNIQDVLMHELIHDATVHIFKRVRDNQASQKEIEAVENLNETYNLFLRYVREDRAVGMKINFQAEESLEEFIANLYTDTNLQAYLQNKRANVHKSLWDRIISAIRELLNLDDNLLTEAMLNSNILLSTGPQNLFSFEGQFSQLDQRAYMFYTQSMDKMNPTQKTVAKRILEIQSRYKLNATGTKYIDIVTNQELDRVSDRLDSMKGPKGELNYYGFNSKYDDGRFEKNRQWGNQTDMILEGIILGKSYDQIEADIIEYQKTISAESKLPKKLISDAFISFKNFLDIEKKRHPGIIFMSQITMGNTDTRVAGTMDLVGIKADGSLIIYDLKTSDKTTLNNKITHPETGETTYGYITTSLAGKPVVNSYTKAWKNSSSKKERHTAQLSFYKGIANSKTFVVKETNIIAFKLGEEPSGGPNALESGKVETMHTLAPMKNIVKSNAYDNNYESSYAAGQSLSKLESTVHKIRLALQVKLDDYISKKHQSGERFIRSVLEAIQEQEELAALEIFINEAHTSVFGKLNAKGETIWPGYYTIIKNRIADIHKGKLKGLEAINKLYEMKEILDLYEGTLKDIRLHYDLINEFKNEEQKGSTIDKLRQLRDVTDKQLPELKEELNDITASVLVEVAESNDENILKAIEDIKRAKNLRIEDHRKDQIEIEKKKPNTYKEDKIWLRKQKYIENLIEKRDAQIRTLTVDHESIKYMLENGADEDISILSTYLAPGIQSSNNIIALYVKLLKDEFEKNRYELKKTRDIAEIAFNKYLSANEAWRDRPNKFNEGIYSVVTIPRPDGQTQHYSFISKTDYEAFERNKAAMFKQAALEKDPNKRKAFIRSWFANHQERIPDEDEYIINPITKEKVVLHMGFKNKLAYLEKTLTPANFQQLLINIESGNIPSEFLRPKRTKKDGSPMYINPKFLELERNSEKKEYHDFLLATYLKSQEKLPALNKEYEKYFIPTRLKDDKEKVLTSPKEFLKYQKDRFKKREEDVEMYGKDTNEVPILYRYSSMPLEDVSLDLVRSILEFEHASEIYATRVKLLSLSHHLLDSVRENKPAETDSKGNPILKKARVNLEKTASKLGIPNVEDYARKHDSNIATLMEGLIDMHIYGKHKKKHIKEIPIIGAVDFGKWADGLMSVAAYTQVGMTNPLLAVSNSLMAETQVLIEAIAHKHYNVKDWAWAEFYYDKNIPNMMNDFTKPANKSLIGQLIDLYDPIQGEFLDVAGRKISASAYSKVISTNSWFWLMRQGEHHAQVKSLLAMLKSKKVMYKGEEISLIDAYELDSEGKLKLKDGIVLDNSEADGLVDKKVKNSLHSINKGMHGNYNAFDKVLIERNAAGRLLTMYRKFVVTGYKRRFDPLRRDEEQGEAVEGTYRTFGKMIFNDLQLILKSLVPGTRYHYSERLTELEKENIRRAAAEFAFIMSTGAILMSYSNIPPPEDENKEWVHNVTRYQLMRLNAELGFFMGIGDPRSWFLPNPFDAFRMFKTPTIALGVINKALRMLYQLHNPGERYQRDAGIAEKGDLKLKIQFYKLLGINGYLQHPDQAIKVLQLQLN